MSRFILLIEEEYGYRHWKADMDKARADELITRWKSMRNLSCLVPIIWICPWAVEIDCEEYYRIWDAGRIEIAHVHEHDDSHLMKDHTPIPEGDPYGPFEIMGKSYPMWGPDAVSLDGPLPY